MGEVVVAVLALLFSLWVAIELSRGTYMHRILSWRVLWLGTLLAWIFSRAFFAWVGLTLFSAEFEEGAKTSALVPNLYAPEIIGVIVILLVGTVLHSRNNRRDHDPLFEINKIAEDKKRWMKANGE